MHHSQELVPTADTEYRPVLRVNPIPSQVPLKLINLSKVGRAAAAPTTATAERSRARLLALELSAVAVAAAAAAVIVVVAIKPRVDAAVAVALRDNEPLEHPQLVVVQHKVQADRQHVDNGAELRELLADVGEGVPGPHVPDAVRQHEHAGRAAPVVFVAFAIRDIRLKGSVRDQRREVLDPHRQRAPGPGAHLFQGADIAPDRGLRVLSAHRKEEDRPVNPGEGAKESVLKPWRRRRRGLLLAPSWSGHRLGLRLYEPVEVQEDAHRGEAEQEDEDEEDGE
eukprot:CAMPEP_0114489874 /NCGR_PEP_ID=MMETSP0109-20121206/2124_1 /TAXON_ID=29199 /ORGANISM="Chlorarachnion reptans, Strain CCCM449" /LENGTH=281 /DNA_ID=CAMNT_0001666419 /DNA_START=610 /DNA_END=1453 /DNA_ORIENTATION=+